MVQLLACRGGLPPASGGRSVDDAQHRTDRELATDLQPRIELLPRPTIHSDLTALAALPTPDEYGAARSVQIALLERQRFADSQSGAPEQNDERAETVALGASSLGGIDDAAIRITSPARREAPGYPRALGVRAEEGPSAGGQGARADAKAQLDGPPSHTYPPNDFPWRQVVC
jgi:hypothetical protein